MTLVHYINDPELTSFEDYDFPPGITTLICDGSHWADGEQDGLLESLIGCPDTVEVLDVSNNSLLSLVGCPPKLKKLYAGVNCLTSLEGCPATVEELYVQENHLTILAGCPSSVKKLYVSYNELTSLEGCPSYLEVLHCEYNKLTSLAPLPLSVMELLTYANPLAPEWQDKTLAEIHEINWGYKRDAVNIIKRAWGAWLQWSLIPNEEGEAPCAIRSYTRDVAPLLS
jgi:hypothetical protein